jgi:MFS family permease
MALLLVSFGSFAGDFGAGAGIPLIFLQAQEWGISPGRANQANSLAALMCGVSGIVWMPLLNSWGRMPVLFWSSVLGFFFTLGAVLSPTFPVHYAMRTLQGVTQSTGQTIGLAFIEDCFFFHEHARKIGIWYAIFLCSPFLSPMFANFIVGKTGHWPTIFWCVLGWSGFLISMILAFGDETYYNRSVPVDQQPNRGKGQLSRLLRVAGVWQIQNHSNYFPTILSSYLRLVEVFLKPVILLTMLFYAALFMWMIGIDLSSSVLLSTPSAYGGYGMSPVSVGFVFFTPIVAVLLGELFGHFFNDYIVRLYGKRHDGHFVPEVRLWATYVGLAFMIPGLVIVGETLQHKLSVAGVVFGWGMDVFGVLVTSVATVAFALDCYPTASGEVSALINLARVGAGFSVPYFMESWAEKQGYAVSFGLQAAVVAFAYVVLFGIQIYGVRLRAWAGPVRHLTSSKVENEGEKN